MLIPQLGVCPIQRAIMKELTEFPAKFLICTNSSNGGMPSSALKIIDRKAPNCWWSKTNLPAVPVLDIHNPLGSGTLPIPLVLVVADQRVNGRVCRSATRLRGQINRFLFLCQMSVDESRIGRFPSGVRTKFMDSSIRETPRIRLA